MSIERWDPFGGQRPGPMRELMDRFFREGPAGPMGEWMAETQGSIPLDVSENDNAFIVRATIPGVKPDDIQAQANGDRLTIRARTQNEQQQEGENYLMRERSASTFYRTITLPAPVNAENAEALYENGVLTLRLPKAAPGKPQQIRVQGATAADHPLPEGVANEMLPQGVTDQSLPEGVANQRSPQAPVGNYLPEGVANEALPQGVVDEALPEGVLGQTVPLGSASGTLPEGVANEALPQGAVDLALPEGVANSDQNPHM